MSDTAPTGPSIAEAVGDLGDAPLTEDNLRRCIWPLFQRIRQRPPLADSTGRPEIYLANHSLGRPLDQTARDVQAALDLWYTALDRAWTHPQGWLAQLESYRRQVAELIGADSLQSIVPKASVGQGLRAVLNALSDQGKVPSVVTTRGEFDSCDLILKTYAAKGRARVRWVEPRRREPIEVYDLADLIQAIDSTVDLVLCSQVLFATGQVLTDLPALTAAAGRQGALVIIDTYHSAGVLPIDWEGSGDYSLGGADFLLGGNYKYTRGGPGAAWLAIHPRHLVDGSRPDWPGRLATLDTGWFAQAQPFAYRRPDPPDLAAGGDSWMESTPPVLMAYQAQAGLELTLGIGAARLREYNLEQQKQLSHYFARAGIPVYQPPRWEEHGGFALLPHPAATELSRRLLEHGVNTDARGGCVRFGPDLLSTAEEFQEAAKIVARVLDPGVANNGP